MKKFALVLLALFTLVFGSPLTGNAFQGGGHSGGGHFGGSHFSGGHVGGGHFGGGHFGGGHFGGGHFRGGHFGGGHFRGGHGVDFVISPAFGPWWWDPYPYYYPYPSEPVVLQSEPVIVEPQAPEQHYWYYCSNPSGYYPYLKQCPNGWMKVLPAPAETP
jgi:hypothetical protein